MPDTPAAPAASGLARPEWRIFATSATLLFAELLLIRWIPANVTYVGFFANFLLIGCFLGMGAGILLGRRGDVPRGPAPLLLLAVVVLVSKAKLNLQARSEDQIFFGLAESGGADTNLFVLPLVVLLATLCMMGLSVPLGPLLSSLPRLRAYAWDIAGSIAGIVAFTALSAARTGPVTWFLGLGLLYALAGAGQRRSAWTYVAIASFGCMVAVALVGPDQGYERWSPYYRIRVTPLTRSTLISVNGIPHQAMKSLPELSLPNAPQVQLYEQCPGRTFERVLIVGAGSGNDVALALARGAKHVDAVEIDPTIAEIGRAAHPAHPFQDPRVELHVEDGRNFLERTDRKYDLVIFALPDSLTLVSTAADIRLESFLFTVESFTRVRDRLAPDGVFGLYNFYRHAWLVARLASMLERAFGTAPRVSWDPQSVLALLVIGPGLRGPAPPLDPVLAAARLPDVPTDDWPFTYLRRPTVPLHYLVGLGCVLVLAALVVVPACRITRTPLRAIDPHFFVLGAAFLLLETRSLVTFSLLFGTTWLVNSLAFAAILVSVLASVVVKSVFRVGTRWPYAALAVALALAWAVPPETLRVDPAWLRYALASLLAFAPIFFANLIFTTSFSDSESADVAFASNILGATVGGALEYLALVVGYRSLALVVGALYAVALLTRARRTS